VIGPIAGGFISETIGYRWVYIIISSLSLPAVIAGLFLTRETYHPVIRARLLRNLGAEEKAQELSVRGYEGLTQKQVLWLYFSRPIVLLTTNVTLLSLASFMAM